VTIKSFPLKSWTVDGRCNATSFEKGFVDFFRQIVELQTFKYQLVLLQCFEHILWPPKVKALDLNDGQSNSRCSFAYRRSVQTQVRSKRICIFIHFGCRVVIFWRSTLESYAIFICFIGYFQKNSISLLLSGVTLRDFRHRRRRPSSLFGHQVCIFIWDGRKDTGVQVRTFFLRHIKIPFFRPNFRY